MKENKPKNILKEELAKAKAAGLKPSAFQIAAKIIKDVKAEKLADPAVVATQIEGMVEKVSEMAGGKEVKFVDPATGETTLTIPAVEPADNFLFEFGSYQENKVHVVIAPDELTGALLLAEHVFQLKYAAKIEEHQAQCTDKKCGCKNYNKQWLGAQVNIYRKRQITKKFPVDDTPHVIGRNLEPLPTKEEMN